jgi:DNA repair exonuclease SbcCD ATPase subunit
MNLEQVADELYALAPAAFTAARDEQAGQARASGDADLAGAIKKLRRPTVSAWLVNLLAREDAGQVDDLLELGRSLREAQQALDGDRLRDLSTQRRRLVAALTQEVQRLAAEAGQAVSAQVEREVQDTLEAALADQGMADAVRSGRLVKPLSYAGLGEGIGVSDAVAVWSAPADRPSRQPASPRPTPKGRAAPGGARETKEAARARREAEAAERAREEAEAAERNRQEAAEDVREAQAGLDEAEQEVTSARDKHQDLQRQIDELERQLDQIQGESAQALRMLRQAERLRDVAARALDGALRRQAKADARVSQLKG